jgi:hypothetical protein
MMQPQYLFQILVLGFTAYVWWLARRDLVRRSTEIYGPATQEWERLQEAVQTLIADLERRATDAEKRVAAAERRLGEAIRLEGPSRGASLAPEGSDTDLLAATERPQTVSAEQTAHDERYAPVYALMDAGVTNSVEIARRTGLGQGEVALILGLHGRQMPR